MVFSSAEAVDPVDLDESRCKPVSIAQIGHGILVVASDSAMTPSVFAITEFLDASSYHLHPFADQVSFDQPDWPTVRRLHVQIQW